MSSPTSIRLSPELKLLKECTDVPFSKRIGVVAERYVHIINNFPCPALSDDTIAVLKAVPGILTMRASTIDHLPRLIVESKALADFDRQQVLAAHQELKDLNFVQRIVCIECLEHLN